MTQLDLRYFEERLLDEQAEIMGLTSLMSDSTKPVVLDQNSVGRLSRMDAMQAQAMAQAGAARQQQRLTQIASALDRIDDNVYGRCLQCDELIAIGRLQIEPTVEYCITCVVLTE